MNRYLIISLLMFYLLSCSTSEQNDDVAFPIRASLTFNPSKTKDYREQVISFDHFLQEMKRDQMIAAGDADLQNLARSYFPDSTIISGFDLHAREIGNVDSFRLVFYEYFDLYSTEHQTSLGVFSPNGKALDVEKINDVSFEGNISINIIDEQFIEIVYYDFFEKSKVSNKPVLPVETFYMRPFTKKKDVLEGFIYEYFKISSQGKFEQLTTEISLSYDRQFPQASARMLAFSELEALSYAEISLMKNEILADHGYIFGTEKFRQQFLEKAWYNPRYNDVAAFLSPIEKINLAKLEKLEKQY